MNTKRVFVVAFAVVVIAVAVVSASMMLSNAPYNPHNGDKWRTDFTQAQQLAESEGTPMVLYVWQEGCTGCEQFNTRLQNQERLQSSVDRYVMVSANIRESGELADRYGVDVTPTMVVLTPDGEKVTSFNPNAGDTPSKLADLYEQARQ